MAECRQCINWESDVSTDPDSPCIDCDQHYSNFISKTNLKLQKLHIGEFDAVISQLELEILQLRTVNERYGVMIKNINEAYQSQKKEIKNLKKWINDIEYKIKRRDFFNGL